MSLPFDPRDVPSANVGMNGGKDRRTWRNHRGMTLAELLAVSCILVMIAGSMGAIAMSVQNSSDYNYRREITLQHGQITVQRIQRTLSTATANGSFPGFLVFDDTVNGVRYPDTLVVWHPTGPAANPQGLPKMNELVVYCPNPDAPNELWEISAPFDLRNAPAATNTAQWRTELDYFKTHSSVRRVVLTDSLREGKTDGNSRGVIRFESRIRPSETEWAEYVAGSRSWDNLSWIQGIHGTGTGLRQAWCRFEFQLRPADTSDNDRNLATPFFGSGAVVYELYKI